MYVLVQTNFQEFGREEDFCSINSEGERELTKLSDVLLLKALAWYTVVYHPDHKDATGFRSFAWLLWDALAYHKRNKVGWEEKQ